MRERRFERLDLPALQHGAVFVASTKSRCWLRPYTLASYSPPNGCMDISIGVWNLRLDMRIYLGIPTMFEVWLMDFMGRNGT